MALIKWHLALVWGIINLVTPFTQCLGYVQTFSTSDFSLNSPNCLEDWKPHGTNSQWRCQNGVLQSWSLQNGIKNLKAPFFNGTFSFDIVNRIETASSGRGETAVWLRNAGDFSGMQRIRVVIEEQRAQFANIRIEEMRQSGTYQRLNTMSISRYFGHYKIKVENDTVKVITSEGTLRARTSVIATGNVYLISGDGEGAVTDFDNFELNPIN